MTLFVPPLREIEFVLREIAGLDEIAALPGFVDLSADLVGSVLEEAGRIASEVLAPINQSGDRQSARLTESSVRTADGWVQAYRTLVEGNWIGLPFDTDFGGMNLPGLINAAINEMWQSARRSSSPMASTTLPKTSFI